MAGKVLKHLLFRGLPEVLGNSLRPSNGLVVINLTCLTYKALPVFIITITIIPITSICNSRRPEDPSLAA
jgi:hypothetical protein